jgi:hypothetical protein
LLAANEAAAQLATRAQNSPEKTRSRGRTIPREQGASRPFAQKPRPRQEFASYSDGIARWQDVSHEISDRTSVSKSRL